jgi:hypothetical protein
MQKQNNQKGFAAFEIVLIVVALIAVGAAGYFAYQSRQDKNDYSVNIPKKKASNPAPTPSTSQVSTKKYLDINEMNIRITLPDDLTDVVYSYDSGSATFTTKSLIALSKYCVDGSPLGGITFQGNPTNNSIKTVNGKAVYFSHSQSLCTENNAGNQLEAKQASEFQQSLQTMTSIH